MKSRLINSELIIIFLYILINFKQTTMPHDLILFWICCTFLFCNFIDHHRTTHQVYQAARFFRCVCLHPTLRQQFQSSTSQVSSQIHFGSVSHMYQSSSSQVPVKYPVKFTTARGAMFQSSFSSQFHYGSVSLMMRSYEDKKTKKKTREEGMRCYDVMMFRWVHYVTTMRCLCSGMM